MKAEKLQLVANLTTVIEKLTIDRLVITVLSEVAIELNATTVRIGMIILVVIAVNVVAITIEIITISCSIGMKVGKSTIVDTKFCD